MKLRLIFAAGLLITALISCQGLRMQSTAAGRSRVQIDEHSILIPGTAIAAADREALNKIFRKYDSSLYRITVYENGSLKKQIGKMDEMQMGEVAQEYSRNAQATGLTNWTNKIGNTTHVTTINRVGNPTHVTSVNQVGNPTHVTSVNQGGNPTHVTSVNQNGRPTHATTIGKESDALVREVTPILEKYSK
jgi:hypothetical protein